MTDKRCCYWLNGLFLGGIAGVVIGLLFAPKSGEETRREIGDKAAHLAERMKEEYAVALEKSKSRSESLLSQLKKADAVADEKVRTDTESS